MRRSVSVVFRQALWFRKRAHFCRQRVPTKPVAHAIATGKPGMVSAEAQPYGDGESGGGDAENQVIQRHEMKRGVMEWRTPEPATAV